MANDPVPADDAPSTGAATPAVPPGPAPSGAVPSDAVIPGLGDVAGLDLGSMLEGFLGAQAEVAARELVGQAGGGAVQVAVTGAGEFVGVTIAPDVVDPDDVGMLEDLVLVALRDAMAQVQDAQASSLGGIDLGGLGGMLGGPS
jgi:nucleoid-associated protein EbfC